MYVHPKTGEQYLQNALILVTCLLQLGLEYDLQALDITRADPISMCLLVCYLYEHLPDYLTKGTIQFTGILHEPSTSQVKITNPSPQTLIYSMSIIGRDADEFQLVKGTTLSIPAKASLLVNIQCKNKRLRPTDAVLLLNGKRVNTSSGSTMVFYLQGSIQTITAKVRDRIKNQTNIFLYTEKSFFYACQSNHFFFFLSSLSVSIRQR